MANTLFDENFGGRWGNCHVALGASYMPIPIAAMCGRSPKKKRPVWGSMIQRFTGIWSIHEKKRVVAHLADGRRTTIYENGCFTY
jgi:aminopeptidase